MTTTPEKKRLSPVHELPDASPNWINAFWRSAFTRWFLLLSVIFFAWAWFTSLVPYKSEWGDIATWVGAMATGGGLIFAGTQIHHQISVRKEETERLREADSRAIGIKSVILEKVLSRRGPAKN